MRAGRAERRGWLAIALAIACAQPTAPAPVDPGTPATASPTDASTAAAPAVAPAAPSGVAPFGTRVDPEINAEYARDARVDHWIARFEREGREVHDKKAEVLAALGLLEGMVVADVGVGTGLYVLDLARAVGPTGRVLAVDVQPSFLEHVATKARAAGVKNVETVRATHDSPNLRAGSIDLAFMCDVYHHIEEPEPYLRALFGALRAGGKLVVIDFARIEGKSAKWLLEHVRADPATFRAEIESVGFRLVAEPDVGFRESFFFVFEKPG